MMTVSDIYFVSHTIGFRRKNRFGRHYNLIFPKPKPENKYFVNIKIGKDGEPHEVKRRKPKIRAKEYNKKTSLK